MRSRGFADSAKNDMSVLQRVKSDLSLPFWCFAGLLLTYAVFQVIHDFPENARADSTYTFGSWFLISWWLWHDAKQNKFVLPMSYGFLVLFAAPIYAPVYIFQTRGWLAFVTIGLYALIFLAIIVLCFVTYFLTHQ
jgi:hypothetical protein